MHIIYHHTINILAPALKVYGSTHFISGKRRSSLVCCQEWGWQWLAWTHYHTASVSEVALWVSCLKICFALHLGLHFEKCLDKLMLKPICHVFSVDQITRWSYPLIPTSLINLHTKIPLNILCNTFSSWKVSSKLKFRKKADQKEIAGLGALLCLTGVSNLPILGESNNTHVW